MKGRLVQERPYTGTYSVTLEVQVAVELCKDQWVAADIAKEEISKRLRGLKHYVTVRGTPLKLDPGRLPA